MNEHPSGHGLAPRSPEAFREVVNLYAALVYSTARRIMGERLAAEEASRAAFLELLHHPEAAGDDMPLWLYSAAIRHARSRESLAMRDPDASALPEVEEELDAQAELVLRHVDDAISYLPEQLQQVLVYRFLADMRHEEIARMLGSSESTIRERTGKAIDRLRGRLEHSGVEIGATALTGVLSTRMLHEPPATLLENLRQDALAQATAFSGSAGATQRPQPSARRRQRSVMALVLALAVFLLLIGVGIWAMQGPLRESPLMRVLTGAADPVPLDETPETTQIAQPLAPERDAAADFEVREMPAPVPVAAGQGAVSGRVFNAATEAPVPNFRMGAFDQAQGAYVGDFAETDAEGRYRISGLSAGTFTIVPTDPVGYEGRLALEGQPVTLDAEEEVRDINFPLQPVTTGPGEAEIAGRITDSAGRPIARVFVSAEGPGSASAFTDSEGRFRLPRLPEGTYELTASAEGFQEATQEGVRAGTTVSFVLEGFSDLDARVVVAGTNIPVTDFEVDFVAGTGEEARRNLFTSPTRIQSSTGDFEIDGLASGRITIGVRASGYETIYRETHLPAGETVSLEIPLTPEDRIIGRVLDSTGAPVAGAFIFLGPVPPGTDWEAQADARTDDSGIYRLDVDPGTTGTISAFHPSHAAAATAIDGDHMITLPAGGALVGVIRAGGAPVSGAEISVQPLPQGDTLRARTTGDGRYQFLGLRPGNYRVNITHAEHGQHTRSVVVEAGRENNVEITLDRTAEAPPQTTPPREPAPAPMAAAVSGRVLEHGAPVSGARVVLEPAEGAAQEATTDAQGAYQFAQVPAGTARLNAQVRNLQRTSSVQVAAGQAVSHDFDFGVGMAQVRGMVRGAFDSTSHGVTVLALQGHEPLPEAGAGFLPGVSPRVITQAEVGAGGEYNITGLSPGTYTMVAVLIPRTGHGDATQIRYSRAQITLGEGDARQLSFDLE